METLIKNYLRGKRENFTQFLPQTFVNLQLKYDVQQKQRETEWQQLTNTQHFMIV